GRKHSAPHPARARKARGSDRRLKRVLSYKIKKRREEKRREEEEEGKGKGKGFREFRVLRADRSPVRGFTQNLELTTRTKEQNKEQNDVDAEKSEVPEADARPAQRQSLARRRFVVWRIRFESSRERMDHRPPDRSLARGHHAFHQARRQIVDSHFSGQAVHQEARGNAHGQRQRRAGALGVGCKAGAHPV